MGAAAYFFNAWLSEMLPGSGELARAARVFIPIGVALVVLAASAQLLQIDEFKTATGRVLSRLSRR
jgi:hypothetical protein